MYVDVRCYYHGFAADTGSFTKSNKRYIYGKELERKCKSERDDEREEKLLAAAEAISTQCIPFYKFYKIHLALSSIESEHPALLTTPVDCLGVLANS